MHRRGVPFQVVRPLGQGHAVHPARLQPAGVEHVADMPEGPGHDTGDALLVGVRVWVQARVVRAGVAPVDLDVRRMTMGARSREGRATSGLRTFCARIIGVGCLLGRLG
jgi:hypothetical protein